MIGFTETKTNLKLTLTLYITVNVSDSMRYERFILRIYCYLKSAHFSQTMDAKEDNRYSQRVFENDFKNKIHTRREFGYRRFKIYACFVFQLRCQWRLNHDLLLK